MKNTNIVAIRKAQNLYNTKAKMVSGGVALYIKCGNCVGAKIFIPSIVKENVKITFLKGLNPKKIKKIASLFEA